MELNLDEYRKDFNIKRFNNLLRYHEDLLDTLKKKTSFLDEHNPEKSERVYCWYNNITEIQKCPHCGKSRKFHKFPVGYFPTCGTKECRAKSVAYGNKYHHDFKEIQKKMRETYAKNHNGITHNMQDPEFKKKFFEDFKKKHNGASCGVQTELANKNREKSTLEKYGVKCALESKEVRNKIYEKYGNNAHKVITDKSAKARKINSLNDIIKKISEMNYTYISNNNDTFQIKCNKCGHINEINRQAINYYYRNIKHIYCNKCEYKELTFRSNFEKDVVKELGNLINDTKYSILTNKHIYNGKEHYEVDILIPELNLAVDCNGLYWHSELQKSDNYYHYKKKEFIEKLGYSLIYIWEDDWNDINKKEIILSRLSSKLKLNKHIYARKCIIKELTPKLYRDFCNENHLHGSVNASIKVGLYYNNELVEVIGLGKSRNLIGHNKDTVSYELLRLCTKKYINVIGGFSKLMKYIITNFNISSIYSYADLSWIDLKGSSYINSGFIIDKIIDNEYWWVVNNIRENRLNYTKNKLVSLGYDKNLTEIEIMHSLKHYRVFGPGNLKLIYKKESL